MWVRYYKVVCSVLENSNAEFGFNNRKIAVSAKKHYACPAR
jgi:hypothetical protein